MRYRLRTLVVLTAIGPPVLAGMWWVSGDSQRVALVAFVAFFLAVFLLPQLILREIVKGAWPE